jgi:hypothetical protein
VLVAIEVNRLDVGAQSNVKRLRRHWLWWQTRSCDVPRKILGTDLEKLGKLRARTVQDALLGTGQIDPSRVFLITQPPQPAVDKTVRLEMSRK